MQVNDFQVRELSEVLLRAKTVGGILSTPPRPVLIGLNLASFLMNSII